jgi:hypothetical protein
VISLYHTHRCQTIGQISLARGKLDIDKSMRASLEEGAAAIMAEIDRLKQAPGR